MSKYTAEQVELRAEQLGFLGANSTTVEMLREYTAYLREREAVVTDELVDKAFEVFAREVQVGTTIDGLRAALEAVAPMLASVRGPDDRQSRRYGMKMVKFQDGEFAIRKRTLFGYCYCELLGREEWLPMEQHGCWHLLRADEETVRKRFIKMTDVGTPV